MTPAEAADCLAREMVQARADQGLPSIAYGITHAGEVVSLGACHDEAHRPVDETTRFRASSITKSITAAATLLLRDRGLVSLDTPVRDVLPWVTQGEHDPMRIGHLLTMTAGLPTDDPWIDELDDLTVESFDEIVARGLTMSRSPGVEYEYSNVGYALLGRVIAAVTGQSYQRVIDAEILQPLGMSDSGFDVPASPLRVRGHQHAFDRPVVREIEVALGAFAPSGGLWTSLRDLARWQMALEASAHAPDGPLPQRLAREMSTPRTLVRLDRRRVADEDIAVAHGYGMGLFVSTYSDVGRVVFHQGGSPGFGAEMRWHPESRWGVVSLSNRGYAVLQHAGRRTLRGVLGEELDALRSARARERMWPETRQAMDWAEGLLRQWDDSTFRALASVTLERQVPMASRRIPWDEFAVAHGPVVRDDSSVQSRSPAHALWRVVGSTVEAWIEVLLSPESPPRVQHLALLDNPGETRVL